MARGQTGVRHTGSNGVTPDVFAQVEHSHRKQDAAARELGGTRRTSMFMFGCTRACVCVCGKTNVTRGVAVAVRRTSRSPLAVIEAAGSGLQERGAMGVAAITVYESGCSRGYG